MNKSYWTVVIVQMFLQKCNKKPTTLADQLIGSMTRKFEVGAITVASDRTTKQERAN